MGLKTNLLESLERDVVICSPHSWHMFVAKTIVSIVRFYRIIILTIQRCFSLKCKSWLFVRFFGSWTPKKKRQHTWITSCHHIVWQNIMPMGRRLHRLNSNFSKKSKKWPVRVERSWQRFGGKGFWSRQFLFESWETFLGSKNAPQSKKQIDESYKRMQMFELWRYFIW